MSARATEPRATPQRLDPLGGLTAQYFTWSVVIIAFAVAVTQVVRHANDVSSPALEAIALLCIVAAGGAVVDGSSARRFPFSAQRHAFLHLLGVLAVTFDLAGRTTGVGESAAWGAVCLAILLMTIGSYRPAAEILLMTAVSSFAVVALVVAFSSGLTPAQVAVIAIGRAAPIAAVGAGAAAFSKTLVAGLTQWQNGSAARAAIARETVREQLLAEVSHARFELLEHRAAPFLQEVLDRGTVTPADAARARGLATSLRRTMLAEAARGWLVELADTVDDPERVTDRMTPEQRMALGALISELRRIPTLVPGSVVVSTATRGSDAVATMTASFTEDGVRLRTAAYLAVLRTYFTRATLASGPGTITVTLEYVPAN
ncbi:MAG: hypothetical protein IT189_03080 [Microbacteriaceae bacterium]|nr:hypothetical protein [Microbacteriaceae bacterium]